MISILDMSFKITNSRLQLHLPGANDSRSQQCKTQQLCIANPLCIPVKVTLDISRVTWQFCLCGKSSRPVDTPPRRILFFLHIKVKYSSHNVYLMSLDERWRGLQCKTNKKQAPVWLILPAASNSPEDAPADKNLTLAPHCDPRCKKKNSSFTSLNIFLIQFSFCDWLQDFRLSNVHKLKTFT